MELLLLTDHVVARLRILFLSIFKLRGRISCPIRCRIFDDSVYMQIRILKLINRAFQKCCLLMFSCKYFFVAELKKLECLPTP